MERITFLLRLAAGAIKLSNNKNIGNKMNSEDVILALLYMGLFISFCSLVGWLTEKALDWYKKEKQRAEELYPKSINDKEELSN